MNKLIEAATRARWRSAANVTQEGRETWPTQCSGQTVSFPSGPMKPNEILKARRNLFTREHFNTGTFLRDFPGSPANMITRRTTEARQVLVETARKCDVRANSFFLAPKRKPGFLRQVFHREIGIAVLDQFT